MQITALLGTLRKQQKAIYEYVLREDGPVPCAIDILLDRPLSLWTLGLWADASPQSTFFIIIIFLASCRTRTFLPRDAV